MECADGACLRCAPRSYIGFEGMCVSDCGEGNFVDMKTQSCKVCTFAFEGCVACESKDKCTKCDRGFSLNTLDQCQPCADGCVNCERGMCLECADDKFMNTNGCVDACLPTQFVKETTLNNLCKDCPLGCTECESEELCSGCDKGF